ASNANSAAVLRHLRVAAAVHAVHVLDRDQTAPGRMGSPGGPGDCRHQDGAGRVVLHAPAVLESADLADRGHGSAVLRDHDHADAGRLPDSPLDQRNAVVGLADLMLGGLTPRRSPLSQSVTAGGSWAGWSPGPWHRPGSACRWGRPDGFPGAW